MPPLLGNGGRLHLRRSNRGFTLTEVMIVIIIAGLLVTTGVPLMSTTLRKARESEAIAGLGAARRAMRMYYVEHHTYKDPQFTSGRKVTFGQILPLKNSDLDGRYFSSECYTFERVKRRTYRIRCDGSLSEAPAADRVADVVLYINQRGDIWRGVRGEDPPHDFAVPHPGRSGPGTQPN